MTLKQSNVINVIDFNRLWRDSGGRPLCTFPHPALALDWPACSDRLAANIGLDRRAAKTPRLPRLTRVGGGAFVFLEMF
jgi:hypothetical protein